MGENEIRQDLGKLLDALRENNRAATEERRTLNQKLEDLSRQQSNIPMLLSDLERRQSQALDTVRRDLERMFVPRVEYEPKHQILVDKIKEYDAIIQESYRSRDEYAKYKSMVNNHEEELKELKNGPGEKRAAIIAVVGALTGISGLILTLIQHFSFHP